MGKGVNKGSNGQFPDHDAIAADTWIGSPYYGSIYVAQAQFHGSNKAPITLFATHDGVHWAPPVTVSSGSQYANQDGFAISMPFGLTQAWPTGFGKRSDCRRRTGSRRWSTRPGCGCSP